MTIFPRSPVWNVIQESTTRPTYSEHIYTNIVEKALKLGTWVQCDFVSNWFFSLLKHLKKKVIVKMPR